jgi:acyl-CoA synthetase (AMP-forming)/AMP-acid ligase II
LREQVRSGAADPRKAASDGPSPERVRADRLDLLIELLRRAASTGDNHPAIITNDRSISYPDLVELAGAIAGRLRAHGITRFGIVDHDAINAVALLAAASAIGVETCVYPPVEAPEEVAALAERFDHEVLVTDRTDLVGPATVLTTAELSAPGAAGGELPVTARPLLVFTTGTTGFPRAVRQDWARVLRPFIPIRPEPDQRWLLAYGLHQFGGLQMLLHVMASGATLVAPVPRLPRAGLAAMRRFGVQYASATPTYWRFILAELHSDGGAVPDLRQITLGGEAVQSRLLRDLTTTFPNAHLSQIYGANESGNLRGVRDGHNGLPISVLDARPDADVALKIVEGELWVRSRIGMLGYYGEEPIDPDAWRATGDLVEVVGDRILFRGRSSEIINVGGVKVHPLPIEERISALPGVDFARVFGRVNAVTGAIVAVELVTEAGVDRDGLRDAVHRACADLPPAARPRSVRFVETIETTGNKMVRGSAR